MGPASPARKAPSASKYPRVSTSRPAEIGTAVEPDETLAAQDRVRECASGATVAVGKGVDGLELSESDGDLDDHGEVIAVDEGDQVCDRAGDAVVVRRDERREAGAGLAGATDAISRIARVVSLRSLNDRALRQAQGPKGWREPPLTRAKQNPRHVEARRGFLG